MSKRARNALIATAAMTLVAATGTVLTKPWETKVNVAYWDAIGRVWTVCYGETKGVKQGDSYTDAECEAMLNRRMDGDYLKPIRMCLPAFDRFPRSLQMSLLDLGWNVGVGAVCKSTAGKLGTAGDYAGACQAATRFDKAGGKTIRGLVNRRTDGDAQRIGERELCLEGLK